MQNFDVVIVGGGPVGSLLGRNMARSGRRTVILEKKLRSTMGADTRVIHLEPGAFAQAGLEPPSPPELIEQQEFIRTWRPDLKKSAQARVPTNVVSLPDFIARLHAEAVDAGAELWDYTEYAAPMIKGPRMVGVAAVNSQGHTIELGARLVVDAGGIGAQVRTSLPPSMGINSTPISSEETLTVYLEFVSDPDALLPPGINTYPWRVAWIAPGFAGSRIIGIGAYGGLTAARDAHAAFKRELFPGVEFETLYATSGRVPYRRPPISLVADGLLCIGDSVYQNRPFSGEGIASGYEAVRIASEVMNWALDCDDTSAAGLWSYNVRWFREYESRFAPIRALMPAISLIRPHEFQYLFEAGFVSGEGAEQMHLEYSSPQSPADMAARGAGLLWGLAAGRLDLKTVRNLVRRLILGGKLTAQMRRYPIIPAELDQWAAGLHRLITEL